MRINLIIIMMFLCWSQSYYIYAETNQSSLDYEISEHIENETKTYQLTTGISVPWDSTNCGMIIQYKAHSQSLSNFKNNAVQIDIFKNNELLDKSFDLYPSESSYGTPIPGYIHRVDFQNIEISQGDRIELRIGVSKGDYKNYVSYLQVATYWQIPDNPMPSYDTLAAFQLNYSNWNNPQNGFVEEITNPPYSQSEPGRRVIFMHDPAPSSDGQHMYSTVSEGMGYALLISYAANDQPSFDSFLRYILTVSEKGCAALAGSQTEACNIKSKLMPWIVDENGNPFWYCSSDNQCYYSSGSASDADIQIAYALSLASKKWPNSNVKGLSYADHFNNIMLELNRFIFYQSNDLNTWLFSPGNCWGTSGLWVLYPGYLTPHALEAFSLLSKSSIDETQNQINPLHGQVIIHNNSPASCHFDYFSQSDPNINLINPPISDANLTYYDHAQFNYQVLNTYWAEFRVQCTQWSIQGNQFFQNLLGLDNNTIPGCNFGFHWENNQWTVLDIEPDPQQENQLQKVYCRALINDTKRINSGILVKLDWPSPPEPDYLTMVYHIESFIQKNMTNNGFKLIPNVMQLDSNYTIGHDNHGFIVSEWSNRFGYDSVRYIMWVCAYYLKNNLPIPDYLVEMISRIQLSSNGVPTNGWNAITGESVDDQFSIIPSLIAPIAVASKSIQSDNYNQLISFLNQYRLLSNKPALGKQSGPYFNAILYLLCEALLVFDGDFDPPILSINVTENAWTIGPIALNQSIESSQVQLMNSGNLKADIFMNASDGQSGWILANQPSHNTFAVTIFDALMMNQISLQYKPQLFSHLDIGTTIPFSIRYFSPITEDIGAGHPQNYSIFIKAYPYSDK